MSLFDSLRRPRFCPACGASVEKRTEKDGFSTRTGKPKTRNRWRCTNEYADLFGHYDSDDERGPGW